MRIDYSEPRQSYTAPIPSRHRPSSGISGARLMAIVVCAGLIFGSGFGVGWHFSQQAAKKAFRAATEQQSLETAAKGGQQPATAAAPAGQAQQPAPPTTPTTAQPGAAPTSSHPELPLSFFDNLPKGQKNTVLGSGINEKPKPTAPASAPATVPAQQTAPAAATKKTDATTAPPTKPAAQPTGYVVQVASYSNRKDADSLRSRLSAKGYAATVSETTLEGKTWYRVRIGRHLDKESASQISNQLMMGAKIVPDQDER